MEQEQDIDMSTSNNRGYDATGVIQIRLDTTMFTDEIKALLEGKEKIIASDKDGNPYYKYQKVANPKANNEGVYSIMRWVKNVINPQVVQGNIQDFDELSTMMSYYREDFSEYLMINLTKFDISVDEYEGLIDNIMFSVRNFLSRLVSNEERKSYSSSIRTTESSSSHEREKRSGFRVPGLRS